jgi:hypothetical protein
MKNFLKSNWFWIMITVSIGAMIFNYVNSADERKLNTEKRIMEEEYRKSVLKPSIEISATDFLIATAMSGVGFFFFLMTWQGEFNGWKIMSFLFGIILLIKGIDIAHGIAEWQVGIMFALMFIIAMAIIYLVDWIKTEFFD